LNFEQLERSAAIERLERMKLSPVFVNGGTAGHQAKLVHLPRPILERRMAMTAAERKLIEKNLDLIFEFEKYVLEYPVVGERIPRNAVVFMKVAGDEKFNRWSEGRARKQAKKGSPFIAVTVKKLGPVYSRIQGLSLEHAA
jgi:hypothetical protein